MRIHNRTVLIALALTLGFLMACEGGPDGMTVQIEPVTASTGDEEATITGEGGGEVEDPSEEPTTPTEPEEEVETEHQQPINEWGDLALTLLSVEPTTGDVSGNTQVVINGTAFKPSMIVLVGEVPVDDVFLLSDTMAAFTTPPHPPGAVDLTVYIPHDLYGEEVEVETAVLESAFIYESEVTIAQVIPLEGDVAGGELVTVVGEGFTEDARFFFDGREAIDTQRLDDYTLMGIAPPGEAGPAHIQVIANGHAFEGTNAYVYRQAPAVDTMSPIQGAAAGGDVLLLNGHGLTGDPLEVTLGNEPAQVLASDAVGAWIQVLTPPGSPGAVVDLAVTTDWGSAHIEGAWAYVDEEADSYVLSCSHLMPQVGPADGGTLVTIACNGLQYGFDVSFGDTFATVVDQDEGTGVFVAEAPPGTAGLVDVTVTSPFDTVDVPGGFTYAAAPETSVIGIEPNSGPPAGGTPVTIEGEGFTSDSLVFIGGVPASGVTWIDDQTLEAVAPPGSPGASDVRVLTGDESAVLEGAFTYTTGVLELALITPSAGARCGGTFLKVVGDGFTDQTEVRIGGEPCEVIEHISAAEIHVRSPALINGLHDGEVIEAGQTVVLPGAFTSYNPRSGRAGTWGGPIDGAVNVSVRGKGGYGNVAGAFVYLRDTQQRVLTGYTNQLGQVTLSEPWLRGPVDVTVSGTNFTAYTVSHYDAKNLTVYVRYTVPSSGTMVPGEPVPDGLIRGHVIGLDKYALPVPGACQVSYVVGQDHCQPCVADVEGACGEGFECVDLVEQGFRCLTSCETPEECPNGYVCAGVPGDAVRCIPHPGERVARCAVSNTSPFSTTLQVPPKGEIGLGEEFELPSVRLGDMAVVCFGGWRNQMGVFTPTAMGVKRHLFILSYDLVDGLEIALDFPLKQSVRMHIMDPPTWPDGTNPPTMTASLDLGADGHIPMTHALLPRGGENRYLLPRQPATLTGLLYDAKYFFFTYIRAVSDSNMPISYNLIQGVTHVVEDRLPYFDGVEWHVETAPVDADLNGIWGPHSNHVVAVGEDGRMLLWNGFMWNNQSSGTEADLNAIVGRADDDAFIVGDGGTVLHWNGSTWSPMEAPQDNYGAAATAPGQPLFVAGEVRVRRYDSSGWSTDGPSSLQEVRAMTMTPDGRLAAAATKGRIAVRDLGGAWSLVEPSTSATLRGIWMDPDSEEIIAVGDGGAVVQGSLTDGFQTVDLNLQEDLLAITRSPNGTIVAVGDNGRAAHRVNGEWSLTTIPGYRSRAHAIFAPPDGGPVRVVGGAAFILGPFLHYTVIDGPTRVEGEPFYHLSWSWDGGVGNKYTSMNFYDHPGNDLWSLVVDGDKTEVYMPDLTAIEGLVGLGTGDKRLDMYRVLNPDFEIDDYSSKDFSVYRRDSWTLTRVYFPAP